MRITHAQLNIGLFVLFIALVVGQAMGLAPALRNQLADKKSEATLNQKLKTDIQSTPLQKSKKISLKSKEKKNKLGPDNQDFVRDISSAKDYIPDALETQEEFESSLEAQVIVNQPKKGRQ